MSLLQEALHSAVATFHSARVEVALVGGLAVSVRVEPRFTRDVDLAVAVEDDTQAEALVQHMLEAGYGVLAAIEHESAGRLAAVRMESEADVVLDLLFASSGIEREIVGAAEPIEAFPDLSVAVARTGHLLVLKLLSRSPSRGQDDWDLGGLLKVADDTDLELARKAARLVSERGFDRGRDLAAELEDAIAARGQ